MLRGYGSTSHALVADIGGTNARFAVADLATLELTHVRHAPCSRHGTLEAALDDYLDGLGHKPDVAVLAVAAPVSGDETRLTNSHWSLHKDDLCRSCGLKRLQVVNDFQALALSLPVLEPHELHQIGGATPEMGATKAVLGPGTGLGVAGLVYSDGCWTAVPGEGGHVSFGASDARELQLLSRLTETGTPMSAEKALSGPGLANLYRAIAATKGEATADTVDVVAWANSGEDEIAVEALEIFARWLGRFAGNVALTFGARGGVYIGGGIAPKIMNALSSGSFREAFEQKGCMSAYLVPIPVFVILAEFATLKGAAASLRDTLQPAI